MMKERQQRMGLPEDHYERIKARLYQRICRELHAAKRILDIGCGSCQLDRLLAEQNGRRIVGVDISDAKFPEEEAHTGALQCRKGDAGNIEFLKDGSMDGVVSVYALHEMNNALKALKEARRVLRPAGRILIVDFPRESLAKRLWNEHYYTPLQVEALLRKAGFADARATVIYQKQLIWAQGRRARSEEQESVDRRAKIRRTKEG